MLRQSLAEPLRANNKQPLHHSTAMQLHHVQARAGLHWLREGLLTFMRQPAIPVLLVLAYLLPMHLLSLASPTLGRAFEGALAPTMTLALMAATARTFQAGASKQQVFLSALQAIRTRIRPLAVLGLMHGAALLLAGLEVSRSVSADATSPASDRGGATSDSPTGATVVVGFLCQCLMSLPVVVMFWHAPGLVHWDELKPVKSVFFSTVTCLRNLGAMAVLGLTWFAGMLALVAWTSFVVTKVVPFTTDPIDMLAGKIAVFVVVAVSEAVLYTAVWFSFRDCLHARLADVATAG
jgi:hypothetical protein